MGIEDIIGFGPGSLGIDIVTFNLVDIANDKEDVDVVGTLVGMVVLSDTNKVLEVLSTPIHIAGSELNNSHGLEDRCNTIVVTSMHHSSDLEGFRETMHCLFILIHLAVDIAESQLSIGNSLIVQTKLALPPLETILVTVEGGDMLFPILVDIVNVLHCIGGLESAAIPLPNLESLVQQFQGNFMRRIGDKLVINPEPPPVLPDYAEQSPSNTASLRRLRGHNQGHACEFPDIRKSC